MANYPQPDMNAMAVFTIDPVTGLPFSNTGTVYNPTTDGAASRNAQTVNSQNLVFNGTSWDRRRGDTSGAWVHAPTNTVSTALSGTIANSGATVTVPFVSTARQEVINPGTSTLWASWGTPVANGAGSFQISPGGTFSTDRTTGTLTLLSTVATQPYTCNRYS